MSSLNKTQKLLGKLEPDFETISEDLKAAAKSKDEKKLIIILERIEQFREVFESINLPAIPKGLDEREEEYREARDVLEEIESTIPEHEESALATLQQIKELDPRQMVDEYRLKELQLLGRQVRNQMLAISEKSNQLVSLWESRLDQQLASFDAVSYTHLTLPTIYSV